MAEPRPGTLFLVVGPSGAGKDTLLAAARHQLAESGMFLFPPREITRAADAGGEEHTEISRADFALRQSAGGYALSWEANGHCYGIPSEISAHLAGGLNVVCNGSRAIVDQARKAFPRVQVLLVTAPIPVLAERIAARGRETAAEVEARLARAALAAPKGADVLEFANVGPVEETTRQFTETLVELAERFACE